MKNSSRPIGNSGSTVEVEAIGDERLIGFYFLFHNFMSLPIIIKGSQMMQVVVVDWHVVCCVMTPRGESPIITQ